MSTPLRVLILEDSLSDTELMLYELRSSGFELNWQRVETEPDYLSQLATGFDVILSDFSMPEFDAMRALRILQERDLDIPLIIVTGSISEEVAVDCMKQGAADYLLKDRLVRLGQAVMQAIQQKELRDQKRQAEVALQESEERFRRLAENAQDIIYHYRVTPTRGFKYVSPAVTAIAGYTPAEHYADPDLACKIVHEDDRRVLQQWVTGKGLTQPSILRWVLKDGAIIWTEHRNVAICDEAGLIAIEGIARDITERKRAEEALSRALKEQRSIMESVLDIVYVLDLKGNLVRWNKRLEALTRLSPEELRGRSALAFFPEVEQPTIARAIKEVFEKGKAEVEGNLICENEVLLPHEWNGVTLEDEAGNVIGMTGIGRDIAERKQTEAQLLHNAFHDALTGLPNRALFMDRLRRALEHAKRHEDYLLAVLFLDLDRFKVINDSLGHIVGDQFLITTANRLKACLRPMDTAARLGGDEFTILLEDIKDISDTVRVAERIQAELRLPYKLEAASSGYPAGGSEVLTTASIGIALVSPTRYEQPEDLLRDADIAMYRAKALGRARYEIFNTDMHVCAVARLQMETDLRRAIERQEFQVHYQPIVSLGILPRTGRITGFEALVRWQHPDRGLIFPGEFMPVAEETGLSIPIDQWVLREACRQTQHWQQLFRAPSGAGPQGGYPALTISVNFCSLQFRQPELLRQIKQVLQETHLDEHNLKLEITENIIMENDEFTAARLVQLRNLGIQLSIDDFGTGYSSLSRLHHFPIDMLKIDRSFISKIGRGPSGESGNLEIAETIVTLAQKLGISVTAEGVEKAGQLAQLRALKCEYGQGHFFSRPLDSQAAEELIISQPRW